MLARTIVLLTMTAAALSCVPHGESVPSALELTRWPLGERSGPGVGPVRVDAADADGYVLAALLSGAGSPSYVQRWSSVPVTGQVQAPSFAAAQEALTRAYPSLRMDAAATSGQGMPIDLWAPKIGATKALERLGNAAGVNVYIPEAMEEELTIVELGAPVDGLARAVAKGAGRSVHTSEGTWFVLREDQQIDERLLQLKGERVTVMARDIDPAVALAAVAQVIELDHTAECGAATIAELRLREATPGELLAALALHAPVATEQAPARCTPPVAAEQDPAPCEPPVASEQPPDACVVAPYRGGSIEDVGELVLVAASGGSSIAVTRQPNGEHTLFTEGDGTDVRVEIGDGGMVLSQDLGYTPLRVFEPTYEGPHRLRSFLREHGPASLRLSATALSDHIRWAVLESEGGEVFWVRHALPRRHVPRVEIEPGVARLDWSGDRYRFVLSR